MNAPNQFLTSKAGTHLIGDAREIIVRWVPQFPGWAWACPDTDYISGPFDTSEAAYRDALKTLG